MVLWEANPTKESQQKLITIDTNNIVSNASLRGKFDFNNWLDDSSNLEVMGFEIFL